MTLQIQRRNQILIPILLKSNSILISFSLLIHHISILTDRRTVSIMITTAQIKNEPIYSTETINKDLVSTCVWCRKLSSQSFPLYTENGDLKNLCSEICFNQYRRASFKRKQNSKRIIKETDSNYINRLKIFSPYHFSTQTKLKSHRFPSPLSILPRPSIEINHFLYPFLPLPIPISFYFPFSQSSCIKTQTIRRISI